MEMGIIAHRVIEVFEKDGELVSDTKGDNNEKPDSWYVTDDDLIGKVKKYNSCVWNCFSWTSSLCISCSNYNFCYINDERSSY